MRHHKNFSKYILAKKSKKRSRQKKPLKQLEKNNNEILNLTNEKGTPKILKKIVTDNNGPFLFFN